MPSLSRRKAHSPEWCNWRLPSSQTGKSLENLNAICVHGNGRPRFPASCISSSHYRYFHRAGTAVNRVEAWFSECCQKGVSYGCQQIVWCAKQAVRNRHTIKRHADPYFHCFCSGKLLCSFSVLNSTQPRPWSMSAVRIREKKGGTALKDRLLTPPSNPSLVTGPP